MDKKDVKIVKKRQLKIKRYLRRIHFSYSVRVVSYFTMFFICLLVSLMFLAKCINLFDEQQGKVINYKENGNIDYKVYLKENEFYDQSYLTEGMSYVASIIKNINVSINYRFDIDELVNTNYSYKVMAKLTINDNQGNNKLYEKEYVLKEVKSVGVTNQNSQSINENVVVDYDYYNKLANNFKSTYGVDANSNLTVYIVLNKTIKNEDKNINLSGSNEMSLSIPLSQKTLQIEIRDTEINNADKITVEKEVENKNVVYGVLSFVLFSISVALIMRTLELLLLMVPTKSKYDKYVKRILTEYDRLIVETPTEPKFDKKEIIKIKRFQELLDARDNLKKPIMHYDLIPHQKCYFYIENGKTIYLLTIKAVDVEGNKK